MGGAERGDNAFFTPYVGIVVIVVATAAPAAVAAAAAATSTATATTAAAEACNVARACSVLEAQKHPRSPPLLRAWCYRCLPGR